MNTWRCCGALGRLVPDNSYDLYPRHDLFHYLVMRSFFPLFAAVCVTVALGTGSLWQYTWSVWILLLFDFRLAHGICDLNLEIRFRVGFDCRRMVFSGRFLIDNEKWKQIQCLRQTFSSCNCLDVCLAVFIFARASLPIDGNLLTHFPAILRLKQCVSPAAKSLSILFRHCVRTVEWIWYTNKLVYCHRIQNEIRIELQTHHDANERCLWLFLDNLMVVPLNCLNGRKSSNIVFEMRQVRKIFANALQVGVY